jgi:hypothetical protein
LKGFLDGNFESNFYTFIRPNQEQLQKNPRHFLIPWTGGAFSPLGPFLCPTTEEK